MSKKIEKIKLPDGKEIEIEIDDVFDVLPKSELPLKDLLTKFDRVYDNQKGFQYKLKGTFGEEGFFTREEAEERYKKTQGKLIYQKGLEPGQVQTEFEAKKPVIKPLGKPADVKKTKRTELDFFGVETSDRPHLESFCVPKTMNELVDELEEATSDPHKSQSKLGKPLHDIVKELTVEIKKLPVCEFKVCNKKTMEKAKKFADYVRDEYNKDRDIMATLGSFGITFDDDTRELLHGLECIGEDKIAEEIKKNIK